MSDEEDVTDEEEGDGGTQRISQGLGIHLMFSKSTTYPSRQDAILQLNLLELSFAMTTSSVDVH